MKKKDVLSRAVVVWVLFIIGLFTCVELARRNVPGLAGMADRTLSSDPCAAAKLYADDARQEYRGSAASVAKLAKIKDPCAVRELIGLLDLPNTNFHGIVVRRFIFETLQKLAAERQIDATPYYSPAANVQSRSKEKDEWLNWYDEVYRKR